MTDQLDGPRPANRPSRRHEIVAAATELFAQAPADQVTIADIAARAGMTPAAFHYHFTSRDELLEEILVDALGRWVDLLGRVFADIRDRDDVPIAVAAFFAWLDRGRTLPRAYVMNAAEMVRFDDQRRPIARAELTEHASTAVRRVTGRRQREAVVVAGVALVHAWHEAARAYLTDDEVAKVLGPDGLQQALVDLTMRIIDI